MKNNILRKRPDLPKLNSSLNPIFPTQEVIDIFSSSDDENEPIPIQVLIPKAEVDPVSSPRAKSMSQEHPTHSEPNDAPSFDLGTNYVT
ncbi:hypothetical protein PIB30_083125 [Stylosanthes scabra]|uniref:Uncharacterized protein n=1 Tax=Stylosanthes scabra TaxID=79078 RepID=A0ABU6TTI3_9FABA|nr:hypothetical protein [Stylosanthes scabra]